MNTFEDQDSRFESATTSGASASQQLFEDYFTAAIDRMRNRPERPQDLLLPAESEAERLDREIQKQPKDVQEWLQKMADEIARTGKLPDELKKAFERPQGDKKGEIKLDWLNRMLEKKGLQMRIELKSEGNLHTMELRNNNQGLDRHEFHRDRGARPPEKKNDGIFEDPDDDWLPPYRGARIA